MKSVKENVKLGPMLLHKFAVHSRLKTTFLGILSTIMRLAGTLQTVFNIT